MMRKTNELGGGLLILLIGTLLVQGYYTLADRVGTWLEHALRHLLR